MRIALVSPYSWTYPGGVTRHIEALAGEFRRSGHHVRVLAPFDPHDRLSARLHRGAWPQERELPEWLVPLGRTIGVPANGAVSNLAHTPSALNALRRELIAGEFDVVHIHEPVAPLIGWDAVDFPGAPLVATFHTFSENPISHGIGNLAGARRKFNRLHVRIAVSEAAAWTGQRFYGGRYRVIPNGVEVPERIPGPPVPEPGAPLRIAFVGQAVERKGLPILLRAFEALREHVPAELVIVGATPEDVEPLVFDDTGVTVLGRVSDEEKVAALTAADVLAAPSLGGESFGMVHTEAYATGTPVVASDIAGYRDVVRDGVDGVLVPRADATALAEALRDLALAPERRRRLSEGAAERARRYAWPNVAGEVLRAYEDAIAVPAPATRSARLAVRAGRLPADGLEHVPPRRLPSLEPALDAERSRGRQALRRGAMAVAAVAGTGLSVLALQRIGLDKIAKSLLASSPVWVLASLALMCAAMAVRAVAWDQILRAALPKTRLRLADAMQGTFIGVLMSATLPARLGEPSRALIVARRTGRPRENLPTVIGTIVSQTLLNILALVLLGVVVFSTSSFFAHHHRALLVVAIAPVAIVALVLIAPAVLRGGLRSRSQRLEAAMRKVRDAAFQVRAGLLVFRRPREGSLAVVAQLAAWALQASSCFVLLAALGLDERAGVGGAAAVLFAVNVSAAVPATPSNLGVFQAATVAVLSGAYGVSYADALAYGIILQAVEIATAVVMGAPALLKEGLSWREVRLRTLNNAPVELAPLPGETAARAKA
jgi:phosphatidylinositol alpha-mannosyltransferase